MDRWEMIDCYIKNRTYWLIRMECSRRDDDLYLILVHVMRWAHFRALMKMIRATKNGSLRYLLLDCTVDCRRVQHITWFRLRLNFSLFRAAKLERRPIEFTFMLTTTEQTQNRDDSIHFALNLDNRHDKRRSVRFPVGTYFISCMIHMSTTLVYDNVSAGTK